MRPGRLLAASVLALCCEHAISFTAGQAEQGGAAYARHCAACHHGSLQGTGHGPELAGARFLASWGERPVAELIEASRATMPPGAPQSLGEATYAAVTAHILRVNGAAPDGTALAADAGLSIRAAIEGSGPAEGGAEPVQWESWQGAGTIAEAARKASSFVNRRLDHYVPVSDALLNDPPPGDWLNWRRTLDGHGFSPLDQINRDTVGTLQLAWVLTMYEGSNQATPLVHDGIMFLTHPDNIIQAVAADSGEVIWEYAYPYPPEAKTLAGPTRNIAIYGNKVFLATYDAALIALDARSGQLLWRSVKADYRQGYTHTAGPIIGAGVVLSGINGCERYKPGGCFITGHDPETGTELWRTSTIAMPGDPNEGSWGGIEPAFRAGGDTWIAGSYDPARELFYIGTSQAKPWVAASRGMSALDAALYTNSTLALDPRSGAMKWYFQHVPGETIDMEVGFERVLVELDGRPLVVTVGKDGILWLLDRRDGRFVAFTETMEQNLFEHLDHATGQLRYRRDIVEAGVGEAIDVCPSIYGGHNWQATSYIAATATLVIPLHRLCVEMVGQPVERVMGAGGYGGASRVYPAPGSGDHLGRLVAYDLRSLQPRWNHTQPAMFLTGALSTAGGLTFIGDLDRYFKAFDSDTGAILWQVRLGAALHGYPISYAVDGEQYLAVPTGMGVFKLLTARQSPQIYQPNGGNALYVFRLPRREDARD